jgi:hypothetical protein
MGGLFSFCWYRDSLRMGYFAAAVMGSDGLPVMPALRIDLRVVTI